MFDRCSLILCTKSLIPTAFWFWSCWRSTSRAMIVPVLPTPALGCRTRVRLVCRSSSAVSKGKRGVWIQLMVYLQWTTVGADDTCLSMCCLTSPLNWIRISVFSGTPWSGQTVKWKCLTLHSSQVPLCEHTVVKLVFAIIFCPCLRALKRAVLHVSLWILSESSWTPPAQMLWWPAALHTGMAYWMEASILHT